MPMRAVGVKRRCGCGAHGGGCAKCSEDQKASARNAAQPPRMRAIGHQGVSREPLPQVSGAVGTQARWATQDFTRLPLNAVHEVFNGNDDEGQESVNAPPPLGSGAGGATTGMGSGSGVGQGGGAQRTANMLPKDIQVDTTTSFTQDALKAGYLSGLGIIARMQVLPDSSTWDGSEVVETVQQTSSTCPATLTQPEPCSGHSHFPIGAPMRGRDVRPPQPAMRNRFYDIHTSQSRDVSFLHDATRNPKGLDACETVCQQEYAFNGVPISLHSIRRQFRKGVVGGRNVTVVDASKSDLRQGPGDFPGSALPKGEQYASVGTGANTGGAA